MFGRLLYQVVIIKLPINLVNFLPMISSFYQRMVVRCVFWYIWGFRCTWRDYSNQRGQGQHQNQFNDRQGQGGGGRYNRNNGGRYSRDNGGRYNRDNGGQLNRDDESQYNRDNGGRNNDRIQHSNQDQRPGQENDGNRGQDNFVADVIGALVQGIQGQMNRHDRASENYSNDGPPSQYGRDPYMPPPGYSHPGYGGRRY